MDIQKNPVTSIRIVLIWWEAFESTQNEEERETRIS